LRNRSELYENLRIQVVDIDGLALLEIDIIYMSTNTRRHSRFILKYIIAHEFAHIVV